MSGKSTFLRTTGVNLLLAFSGAPVNADEMRLVLLRLFTCIQVSDSLSDGFSYFYAEVRRLKSLLNLLEEAQTGVPVFYLIDEIFRGTNNRERRIGSQSFVRALARLPGSGVISTHDLELVKLADGNQRILNYHFRDDVLDGRMIFDYKLRPGPSPSTNALKIMKNEGLPVEE
jgi:DNA mismatch repair ATPase MutS